MKYKTSIRLSRENHLNHMIRVVPFIFGGYAIQCFVIYQMAKGNFTATGLSILGGLISLMVGAFIAYDLKHQVDLMEDKIQVSFFSWKVSIKYTQVEAVEVIDPTENFSTLIIYTAYGKKHRIYFVDNALKIKQIIEDKNKLETMAA